ncbi:MAG TPA: anti-sigma factor [Candidatus Limnocylindrales bacterium]|nr:anti-sigma factor [Candidatus Limnocylindrales bacterium]
MTAHPTLLCDEARDLVPLYVTGALDDDEAAAVREHLAHCPEPHPELLDLGETATALLEAVEPVAPPPALKGRLLAAAAADLASGAHPGAQWSADGSSMRAPESSAPDAPISAVSPPVIDLASERAARRPRVAWLVAVAAVIGVIALGAANLGLRRDLDQAQAYRQGVDQALTLAGQPGSVTALLAGDDGAASGLAVIGADGTTRIAVRGLAPTSGSQVYTAWAIEGDAAPVALGDFTVTSDGLATATVTSPTATPGAVVALTLEPVAGATAPAGPVVAAGTTGEPAG